MTSRPAHHSARITYSFTDALAGLDEGAGIDRPIVLVTLHLRQSCVTETLAIPAGACAGEAGWRSNGRQGAGIGTGRFTVLDGISGADRLWVFEERM
jgi:hypothetical protein